MPCRLKLLRSSDMTIRRDGHTCRLKAGAVKDEAKEDAAVSDDIRNAEGTDQDGRVGEA